MRWTRSSAPVATVLFAGAVVASLFFHGLYLEFLCLAEALLLSWGALAFWQSHDRLAVPVSPLGVTITLFWLWLGVSLAWTEAPAIAALNFWWVGSLPLAFWLYTLTPDREAFWRQSALAMLILGVVLAAYAAFQLLVLSRLPRSLFININSHAALLNLLILPLVGYFVLSSAAHRARALHWSLGACLFLLVYALAITRGRGAIVAFVVSIVFFLGATYSRISKQRVLTAIALTVAAFAAGNISSHGELADRLETLSNPTSAGATRLVIWQQAWAMILDQPLWGHGLGSFALVYPQYRLPADTSAGGFVHNDYLQLWIEIGLPGLALFVAVWLALAFMFWRSRARPAAAAFHIEVAALTAGLLAVALHGAVDFNFYQVPILLIVGAMLGRLHALTTTAKSERALQPRQWLTRPVYRIVVVGFVAIPMAYFIATAAGAYYYRQGLAFAEVGALAHADRALAKAMRLSPSGDNVMISRADLNRHALREIPELPPEQREQLYADALAWLADAEKQNPLRPLVFHTRGLLYAENPTFAGLGWRQEAVTSYLAAMRLDPRYYPSRVAYAELLVQVGNASLARTVLEEGMRHWYLDYDAMVPYYALTAKLRRLDGDIEGAEALEARIKVAMENSGWRWVPRADGTPKLISGPATSPAR